MPLAVSFSPHYIAMSIWNVPLATRQVTLCLGYDLYLKFHPNLLPISSFQIYWPAPVEWREECNWAGKDINVSFLSQILQQSDFYFKYVLNHHAKGQMGEGFIIKNIVKKQISLKAVVFYLFVMHNMSLCHDLTNCTAYTYLFIINQ